MSVRITNADLDDWSRRRDSEEHLPTLIRRLIMASIRPDWIRMPAAEGVALAGLDGVVSATGSSHRASPPATRSGSHQMRIGPRVIPLQVMPDGSYIMASGTLVGGTVRLDKETDGTPNLELTGIETVRRTTGL
jgi:hypothetical protein